MIFWFFFPNVLRFPICPTSQAIEGSKERSSEDMLQKVEELKKAVAAPSRPVKPWEPMGCTAVPKHIGTFIFFFTTDLRLAKCGRHYQEIIVTFLHPYEWDLVLWYSAQNKATQQRFHEKTLRTPYLQAPALVVNPIRQPYCISSAPPYLNLPYYTPMKYHHFPQALFFVILNRYCIHRKKKSFIQKKQGASPKKFLFLFYPWVS